MVVLDGNLVLGFGPRTDYPQIRIFQCMLERTDAITYEVLEPITFVLAYPTVLTDNRDLKTSLGLQSMTIVKG